MTTASDQLHLMGTVIDLVIEADDPAPLLAAARRFLIRSNQRYSANDPSSELGAVNRASGQEAVTVAPELFDLIALGREHSLAPGSMLNIAIGPLVQLWRIGFADARVPRDDEIEATLARTDPSAIELDPRERTVHLRRPGMQIDLGALAKGWIADLLVAHLRTHGARSVLVNLGGNVMVSGPAPGRADGRWRAGLRHPEQPEQMVGAVSLAEESFVTSGVYQRVLVEDGKRFHHLLDPATGHPITTEVTSLSIRSERSVDGEIWTSRLFGRPVPEILAEVSARPGLEAVVITEDLQLAATRGMQGRLELVS